MAKDRPSTVQLIESAEKMADKIRTEVAAAKLAAAEAEELADSDAADDAEDAEDAEDASSDFDD